MSIRMEEFDYSMTVGHLLDWIDDIRPKNPEFIFGRDGEGQPKLIITYEG